MQLLPTEHEEHAAIVEWAQRMVSRYPPLRLLYAVPNGARTSFSVAKRLKAEGMQKGVPDLCLPAARKGFHALYLEVKRKKGGRLSAEQRWWGDRLREEGNFVVVVHGAERGIHYLERYLDDGTFPP